jgi:hypothetical protein
LGVVEKKHLPAAAVLLLVAVILRLMTDEKAR